jgi:cation transport regulator ChaC
LTEFVFGYGSLVAGVGGVPCRLRGYRRAWDVAMDNGVDLPGYKHYVDPVTGARPEVMVTFLSIAVCAGGCVGGVAFPVDGVGLAALDARERNYRRCDVRRLVSAAGGGLDGAAAVWAYVGSDAARGRYADGADAGRAVISRDYHDRVLAGFAALGPGAVEEFRRTTAGPDVPVVPLLRVG